MYHKQLIIVYGCKVIARKSHYPKDVPFEVPEGWVWVRGDEIFLPMESTSPSGEFFDYIDIDAIDNKHNVVTTPKRLLVSNAPSRASRLVRKGDILFSMVRPYLRNIARIESDGCIASTGFYVCRCSSAIDSKYCYYLMLSDYVVNGLNQFMKGDNSPSINNNHIISWIYPLPPIAEQRRICNRIEALFSWVYSLEKEQAILQDDISFCRTKILDLAIHGKLVPQDPSDEPAIELLRRINPAFKPSDNLHYETQQLFTLPNGWEWCSVKDYSKKVTDYVASGSFASLKDNVRYYKQPNYAILIKTKDFANNFSEDLTYTDEKGYNFLKNSNLYGGELVFSNVGSVGKIFKVPHLNIRMSLAPNAIMVKFHQDDQSAWFERVFQSPFGQESLRAIASATAIMKFNKTDFGKLLIPVPPVSEQKRILDAIDAFLAQLDCINDTE